MLRIALCEGNDEVSEKLKEHLTRYGAEKETECDACVFTTGADFLAEAEKFDVAIIDVELREENGVDVATKLREKSKKMPVVFLSSSKNFSFKGYEVDVVDFLTTPVGYYEFSTILDRVQLRLVKMDIPYIAIMTRKGAQRISVDEIEYIEGGINHVVYHTTKGDIRAQGSLNDEAKKVTADRFFRLGGNLVNLAHVNKVWGADVYVGKACLPLPHKQKAALQNSLLAFMNRG